MKRGAAERRFRVLPATVVQVKIICPSEAHSAMNLDATIADCSGGIAAVHLGDGDGGRCIWGVFFQRPTGVIHRRSGTLGFQIHIRTLVLDSLKNSNGFPE